MIYDSGTIIIQQSITQPRRHNNNLSQYHESNYKWPPSDVPQTLDWQCWREKQCQGATMKLKEPLGNWLPDNKQRTWKCWINQDGLITHQCDNQIRKYTKSGQGI